MISAIILAAGASRRMGQPKLLLPWGGITVLEQVVSAFARAGIQDIRIVTGAERARIEEAVRHFAARYPVKTIHNEAYADGEMLSSLQCGLRALQTADSPDPQLVPLAALIGLGDQPQVEERTVHLVRDAYHETGIPLIVPSFKMRRGHPWLVARPLWTEVLNLPGSQSPRDFLNAHADQIHYVASDSPSILADLDTPEDYRAHRPKTL